MGLLDTIKQMAKQQYSQGLLNQVLTNPASIGTELGQLFDPKYMSQVKPMSQDEALEIALTGDGIKTVASGVKAGAKAGAREVARQIETGTGVFGKGTIDPRQYMFIGENAKTWNPAKAKEAVKLEKSGLPPEQIWTKTGTLRGVDGKLRQEISDNLATTTFPKKNVMGTMMPMDKRLNYDDLYKAYPEFKKMDLELIPDKNGNAGAYNGRWVELATGEAGSNPKPIILHELQHAIQDKENFSRGGSPENFPSAQDINDAQIVSSLIKKGNLPSEAIAWVKNNLGRSPSASSVELGMKENVDLFNMPTNTEQYKRLAGEAEARLTENRMNLTPEQRLQYFPYNQGKEIFGLDVPYNELIVRGIL